MTALLILFGALVGAAANRHRGGWLPTGHTQLARLNFACIMTLILVAAGGHPSWWWLAFPVGWFFGCLAGQGEGMWMGRGGPGDNIWWDTADLAGSGLWNVVVPVAVLWWTGVPGWWWLLAAGLAKPAAYYVGNRLPVHIQRMEQGPELSEVIQGAVLGAACVLAATA